jgi:hypothetical protein
MAKRLALLDSSAYCDVDFADRWKAFDIGEEDVNLMPLNIFVTLVHDLS